MFANKHEDCLGVESQGDYRPGTNLFSRVAGQVEDEDTEKTDSNARNDQVDGVGESLASNADGEEDVRVRFEAAVVLATTFQRRHSHDVPFDIQIIFTQVDAVPVELLPKVQMFEINLCRKQIGINRNKSKLIEVNRN